MPIVLNGDGTVTGITAGGLPNGCITADDLASGVGGKFASYALIADSKGNTTDGGTFTGGLGEQEI